MVGPGLMITASHVLDEFPTDGSGPVCVTFLQTGAARAWLPTGVVRAAGESSLGVLPGTRKRVSDLTLMSCSLHSQAHEEQPLLLAPIELCLPLPGQRLWAVGFRYGAFRSEAAEITPLVSSGIVTNCFVHGRGNLLPSPCIEVDMDSRGGMSGGPVFNERGGLVGIVSSSFDGGPTYVTLVWDAMRLSASPLPSSVWPQPEADLFLARQLGLVKIKGDVHRDSDGNVTLKISEEEFRLVAAAYPPRHS